jgi:hypothetical protein
MTKSSPYYYVTVGTNEEFLDTYSSRAIMSLINTGVCCEDIHFVGGSNSDVKFIKKHIGKKNINYHIVKEDLSNVKWKYSKGKRKYSLFKAAALYKAFTNPIKSRHMVYFDGDVLWYEDPREFFDSKNKKTWFHHGKDLAKRSKKKASDIDIKSFKSLSKWCSAPMAHLMAKYGIGILPEREVVAGLYMLHNRDHSKVLKLTYEGCLENSTKFARHEGGGDQKPMNAALNILGIDWHGGSRFLCPDHVRYFDHFFGKDNMKCRFLKKAKNIGL